MHAEELLYNVLQDAWMRPKIRRTKQALNQYSNLHTCSQGHKAGISLLFPAKILYTYAHTGNSITTALLSGIKISNRSARKEVQFNDEMPTEQETTTGSGSNATTNMLHRNTKYQTRIPRQGTAPGYD